MQTQTFQPHTWLERALVLPNEPTVSIVGYAYRVDLGLGAQPRSHIVHKDKTCSCGDPDCAAVQVVAEWLKTERVARAPDPPTGYTLYLPRQCPICGSKVLADHTLSSRTRGIGWRCACGGLLHYWQDKVNALKARACEREWAFPPVVDETGRVLYAGVRLSEIPTGLPMGYLPECNR